MHGTHNIQMNINQIFTQKGHLMYLLTIKKPLSNTITVANHGKWDLTNMQEFTQMNLKKEMVSNYHLIK